MVEKVASGIWRVGGGPWALKDIVVLSADSDCNVYLLKLGEANVLVDTGSTPGQDAIEANIRECGVEPRDLTDLILTHSHFDHTECAHRWRRAYGVRIHFNSVGTAYLARNDFRLVGHQAGGPDCVFTPFVTDHPCEDGETFEIGGVPIKTYHLPGHTPDCTLYAFEHEGRQVGICGDITFAPRPGSRGELGWLCLLWESNLSHYRDSLRRFLGVELDILLTGHGHPLVGKDAIQNALTLSLGTVERLIASPDSRHYGVPD